MKAERKIVFKDLQIEDKIKKHIKDLS